MNSIQQAKAAVYSELEAMKIAHDESIKALDNNVEDQMAAIMATIAAMQSN
jgi:hypothetical protein